MRSIVISLLLASSSSFGWLGASLHAGSTENSGSDYCAVAAEGRKIEIVRPGPDEEPVDDVNWFARPVWNDRGEWIIAFASHDRNYLYNLSTGRKIRIPDRSDAVATPDGRFMTVPSHYTPDGYIRFYDVARLLDHLDKGIDAHELPPVFIHKHPDLRKVYYQSTAVVRTETAGSSTRTVYRLMFSGTRDEAQFRIVDYEFVEDSMSGALAVHPSGSMRLCPEITNDLNTPFLSKDGRYVVSYTSSSQKMEFSPGSSLKIFSIAAIDPEEATTGCEELVDFGFAAGKADFSFDNSMLTFHISKGGYLTPFINGGLDPPTVTDVVIVELTEDSRGNIDGYSRVARVTTSTREGVGSYFPAFLPDGKLFYVFNAEPKTSQDNKRFYFKVVDPVAELRATSVFADAGRTALARALGKLWESACTPEAVPLAPHEAPWVFTSLTRPQCLALVGERWVEGYPTKESLVEFCDTAPSTK
ncbi:MAG TPA: hypothetical protein VEK15_30020 [Vicinamibacteria bacterium]|nr:hypothetical protein [Vicinamibacteria bacterium]